MNLVLRMAPRGGGKLMTLGLAAPPRRDDTAEVVPVPGFPGFAGEWTLYRPNWRSTLGSLLIHALAVNLIPILNQLLPSRIEDAPRLRVARYEPLRIQVPEPLYVARPAPRPARRRAAGAPRKKADAGPAPAKRDEIRVVVRRPFELPPTPAPVKREQTLLQLPSPPEAKVPADLRLPQVMFWSQTPARAPRPPARKFIMPGRSAPEVRQAELAAPPRLETPNAETRISELKVAALPSPKLNPALPVPPGTPMPVKTPSNAAPQGDAAPAVDSTPGEPVNVLALNPNPAPLTETIVIPPGNQVSTVHAPANAGDLGNGGGARSGEDGRKNGPAKEGAGGGKAGGGTSPGGGTGARGGTSAGGGTGAGGGTSTGSVKPGAVNGAGSGQPPARIESGVIGNLPEASVPIRVVHPANGVFDVVIQSAGGDLQAETAGILTGRPVYSVYLRVGGPKDWILQYCSPAAPVRNTGPVVQLGNPSPLKSPFPLTTVIPSPKVFASKSRMFIHGYLTDAGSFRNLRAVRGADADAASKLIPFLQQWEFRPATRDGRPVEVELLLVIPATGS